MIKKLLLLPMLAAALSAAAAEPALKYDFTGEKIVVSGKYASPVKWENAASPLIRLLGSNIRAAGFTKNTYQVVNDAKALHTDKGLTVFAEVRFNQPSVRADGTKTYEMILFKNNSFLLGRSTNGLYFNLGLDGKFALKARAPMPPVGKFVKVGATVKSVSAEEHIYKIFIDGKVVTQGSCKGKLVPQNVPVMLFIGWGKQWLMEGDVKSVAIYTQALTDEAMAKL